MANTFKFGNGQWATKEGSTLAYNDENGNFKPLPFTFDRASSATRVNKDGLIETVGADQPRIDYLNDSNGALLLEPSRSNISYPSEDFSNQLQGASSTFGTVISPNGTLNGSTIKSTADGTYKGWHKTYSLTDNTYTFSMFVKYYNSQWISIYRIGQAISRFDVKNGVFGNNPSNLKSVDYGNGWYRLEFTFTASVGTNWLYIYPSSDSGETSSLGDGLHIWGGQLEQGSYATSYIPTSGSAVTRLADSCSGAGNEQVINSTEGVLYYEASYIDGSDYNSITLSNNSGYEKLRTWYDNTNLVFASWVNDVNQTFIAYPISKNINYKIAIRYKLNDFALYVNGNKATNIIVNLGGVSPQNSYNKLNLNSGDVYNNFYGNVKDIKLYNTALTDAELAALTS